MADPITPPSNIGFGTVVWQAAGAMVDSVDGSDLPDFDALTGTVTFEPTPVSVKDATSTPNPITIAGDKVTGTLGPDGYLGVQLNVSTWQAGVKLVATDDADLNPTGWAYRVTYNLRNSRNQPVPLPSHLIAVPEGSTVDLTLVQPVDGAAVEALPAAQAAAAIAEAAAAAAAAAALAAQAAAEAAEAAIGTAVVSVNGEQGLVTVSLVLDGDGFYDLEVAS